MREQDAVAQTVAKQRDTEYFAITDLYVTGQLPT